MQEIVLMMLCMIEFQPVGFVMASTVYLFLQIILISEKNNRRIVLFAAVAVFLPLAVILFLPMTFSFEVTKGISLLVGLYMGGISGGLISGSSSRYPTR